MKGVEVIRSATFEGMADDNGFPTAQYVRYYAMLSQHVKTIVTGFLYVSETGRAMHPGQAGLDTGEKAEAFRPVTEAVHQNGGRIIAQLAHVGRQTIRRDAVGVSAKASPYFGVTPRVLTTGECGGIVEEFARSAFLAREAGFDGVQLHCAHGYLIHQFLLGSLNDRTDAYGDPHELLRQTVRAVRSRVGGFPIWVKISADVDIEPFRREAFLALIRELDSLQVDAIEVSRGTMDRALNIFRGGVPVRTVLRHNPIYAPKGLLWRMFALPRERLKLKGFQPCYNLEYARLARVHTRIPVIPVGGFRGGREIREAGMEQVSLCRPFIREPDFLRKLERDPDYRSKCTSCNICAVMVDTRLPLRCFGGKQP